MKKLNEKRRNHILNVVLLGLALLFGLVIIPTFIGSVNPAFQSTWYGFRPYVVETDSMEPYIMTGALLIGRVTPFENLQEGDIITFDQNFSGEIRFNTHRIINIQTDADGNNLSITTQGDNANAPDHMPITRDNFRYRVVFISNNLTLVGALQTLFLFIVLPAGIVMAVSIGLAKALRGKKQGQGLQPQGGEVVALPESMSIQEEIQEGDDELLGLIEGILNPLQPVEDDLLALIDAALNLQQPQQDLNLLLDAALGCEGQDYEKEDYEWFDQLMWQRGISLK